MSALVEQETLIRLFSFISVLAILLAAEVLWPNRARVQARSARWTTHLALSAINSVLLRLIAPGVTILTALWAGQQGIGLLNWVQPGTVIAFLTAFALLDLAIYGQHVAMHRVPLLWSMHQVHHADRDLDATTAIRFHPFEMLTSLAVKIAVILALGAPAAAVLAFEIVLNGSALLSHANVRLPGPLDRVLRWLIVTPDMHLVHHSIHVPETNSNFGFNFSLWDRLFGTYRPAAFGGPQGMTVGLEGFQTAGPERLMWCLALPWRKAP